jgi:cyclopropane fatty-acyl-phospholipid synthase-like methyltransferase
MQNPRLDPATVLQNKNEIHAWYENHAHEFANAAVIEHAFVGKSAEFQERLNRFKLWAVDRGDVVSLNGKHVLEFGAGHGRLPFAYPGMASYTGVDYARNLVDIGNERLRKAGLSERARIHHGDVTSFDGPKRHFDVVCSLGMMAYFPDPAPVVTSMELFLKPGGVLFFDFRVASALYAALRRVKWALRPPTGGTTFSERVSKIETMLTGLGLTNVQIRLREFPFLAEHYASAGSAWALNLRNALSKSRLMQPLATEAWVFATKPG